MFKNFNWKKFAVNVFISWGLFAFVVGFIKASNAQERTQESLVLTEKESTWIYIGISHGTIADIELDLRFYALRNSLMVSDSGNPVIVVMILYGHLGKTFSEIEFDCDKGLIRSIKSGTSLETMVKRESSLWLKPPTTSAGELLLKRSCNKLKE